jgi:hypothetical protein
MELDCFLTFHHNVPSVPCIKCIQDAVFSDPSPSTFTEFWKRLGLNATQKLVDEILLELTAHEHIQSVLQSTKIERCSARFTFPYFFFYLSKVNAATFWAR